MTTFHDLLVRFSLFVVAAIVGLTVVLSGLIGNIFLGFIVGWLIIAAYLFVLKTFKDTKRISVALKEELAKLNYTILEERPLTIREQYENYELDLGFNYLDGISTNSWLYKAKMLRHLKVVNEKDHYFELIVTVVQTWRDKIIYKINSTTRIRD